MPPIKIDHIVSFSSEDSVHTANNILSTDASKKWKCQTAGEKEAIVVLQLEKASQITAIDIGNEQSAYVKVLVSRSGSSEDYKVLLVTSAFMTPLEARQSQNVNKVRMFTKDQLSKPECEEKWDRVKIICTQPFNKRVQFGLTFVTLHSNTNKDAETSGQSKIGKFSIRPESPDNISVGSLFAKRKELKLEEKPTAAAAIRAASSSSSLALYGSPTCKPKLINKESDSTSKKKPSQTEEGPIPKNRNRNELFYTDDDEEGNEKIDKIIKEKEEETKKEKEVVAKKLNFWGGTADSPKAASKRKKKDEDDEEKKEKKKRNKSPCATQEKAEDQKKARKKDKDSPKVIKNKDNTNTPKRKKDNDNDVKRKLKDEISESAKPKKAKEMKPFYELLNGVTLVISGIQNPDRANLRTMALSMGAKYKPDWDDTCTHLICAFTNTPKFNQVKGKGKIVKRSWIENCHKERKRLPWRRYALDKSDLNKDESEDEIHELIDKPSTSTSKKPFKYDVNGSDDNEHKAEGSDTEERIARILAKKKEESQLKKKEKTPQKKADKKQEKSDDNISEDDALSSQQKRKPDKINSSENLQSIDLSDSTDEESLNSPKHSKKRRRISISTNCSTDEESLNSSTNSKKKKQSSKKNSPNSSKKNIQIVSSDDNTDEEINKKNVESINISSDEECLNTPNNSKKNKLNKKKNPKSSDDILSKKNHRTDESSKNIKNGPKISNKKNLVPVNISSDDSGGEESLNVTKNKVNKKHVNNSDLDVYEVDTEDECDVTNKFSKNRSLDVFSGEKFYVDQNFDEDTYNMLCKYIIAYNGKCMDDVTGDIDIIVTTKEHSKSLKEINQKAKCIDRSWILQTHRKGKLVPVNNFVF